MALDFPASPTFGEVFTSGNPQWQWDGTPVLPPPKGNYAQIMV